MNRHLLKTYLKHNLLGITISIAFFVVFYFFLKGKISLLVFAGVALFNFIEGFFDYKKRQEYLMALAAQGLTEKEADDGSFITKWENIKKGGIIKYCLIDGGILIGIWLVMFVGLITVLINLSFFETPFDIVQFLEFVCPIAASLGVLLSFFMWTLNEKRYARLTDPLH